MNSPSRTISSASLSAASDQQEHMELVCDFGIYGTHVSEIIKLDNTSVFTDFIKQTITSSTSIKQVYELLTHNSRSDEANKMLKLFLQNCSFLVPVNRIRTDYDVE